MTTETGQPMTATEKLDALEDAQHAGVRTSASRGRRCRCTARSISAGRSAGRCPAAPRTRPRRRCKATTRACRRCRRSRRCSTSSSTAGAPTRTCCRAPRTGPQGRLRREDDARLPAARHRRRRLHPQRPRLLGRAAARAVRRRGGELGDPRAPGAALLPDESVGYTYPEMYVRLFGEDFQPEEYIQEEYKRLREATSGT